MKYKLAVSFLTVIITTFIFFSRYLAKEPKQTTTGEVLDYVRCTAAKFLLDDIDTTRQIAPLFENLGSLNYPITTQNKEAQTFFNQGLRLTYAFNHAEAHRSFLEASRLDPAAPMPYWGQAYALGPNINDPLPDTERKIKAYEALVKAQENAANGSLKEQALITALGARYSADTNADLKGLNEKYMHAMEDVKNKYPGDADIQTLYAASVMNTMPWNYWDNEGNPAPNTLKGKEALEKAISINPSHPGAHHYYIHMVELPKPELAIRSAEKLGKLMPAAGHLVHMPSHIFIRVGRYQDAVKSNQDAILADEDYISQCYSQGMYPLGYYPHNIHFLWSAASLLGDSKTAIEAAKKTAEKVPVNELANMPFLQDFASTPLLAYTRFGKWNEVLTIPYPGNDYKHLKMIWHYARGIAFLRKNNLKEAKEELAELNKMQQDTTLKHIIANYTNPTSEIANVAQAVLAGEVAYASGNTKEAMSLLEQAIKLEDQLIYSEPAPWHIPARQTLGNVLLHAGKYDYAEKIFKEDLAKNRQNGWSLKGLHESLQKQGKTTDASRIKKEFDKAWAHADIKITRPVL